MDAGEELTFWCTGMRLPVVVRIVVKQSTARVHLAVRELSQIHVTFLLDASVRPAPTCADHVPNMAQRDELFIFKFKILIKWLRNSKAFFISEQILVCFPAYLPLR